MPRKEGGNEGCQGRKGVKEGFKEGVKEGCQGRVSRKGVKEPRAHV